MILNYKNISINVSEWNSSLIERGYNPSICSWSIHNNKLFINETGLFVTGNKQADWIDASLSIRVNDNFYNNEYYNPIFILKIEIKNGIITNKRIVLEEVNSSFSRPCKINNYKIDNYLKPKPFYSNTKIKQSLLSFFKEQPNKTSNKWINKIYEEIDEILKIRSSCSLPSLDFFKNGGKIKDLIADDIVIAVSKSFIFLYLGDENYNKNCSKIIEYYINFLNESINDEKNITFNNNSINYLPYKVDFNFVKWAIRNLDWFVITPSFLNSTIMQDKRIKLNKINDVMFEYEIEKEEICIKNYLNDEDIDINLKKINLKYDRERSEYTLNEINDKSYLNYLISDNITDYEEVSFEEVDYNNTEYYDYEVPNDSNWLRDAAGTDDPEIMNDVFWNLD